MEIKAQILRDGTGQRSRSLRSLDPDFVSVDERTLADRIRLAQTYAKDLTYFNERNQPDGDWSAFFAGDAEAIAEAIQLLESNDALEAASAGDPATIAGVTVAEGTTLAHLDVSHPDRFPIDPNTLRALTQPQMALFLTFLRLLRYPQQQFKARKVSGSMGSRSR